jgi:hypothetical protein
MFAVMIMMLVPLILVILKLVANMLLLNVTITVNVLLMVVLLNLDAGTTREAVMMITNVLMTLVNLPVVV